MQKLFTVMSCTAALALTSPALYAQDSEDKLWSGGIEFGYVDTSGNTEETTTKSRIEADREKDQWRYKVSFDYLNSESNGVRTAEKFFLANRLAYQYSDVNYTFGYVSYDDDRFSGFDYQSTIALGWGRRLLNDDKMQWDVEIGPGYRISKVDDNVAGEDSEEAILRAYTQYNWDFSDTANFNQSLNIETGADNTISKSISALKVQVMGDLSLKLSYTIKYTEEVPVGTKHADTETAVTLAYSF